MLQHRLDPAAYQRAVVLSEYFDVEAAQRAGFFDEVVNPVELMARAQACAAKFSELDMLAHTATKRRIRASLIRKIRIAVPLDLIDAGLMGLRGTKPRKS
jgi:enoyl-CoA hydratase